MWVDVLKGKVHRARVTGLFLHYEGSLTLDPDLMDAAGLFPNLKVQVVNLNNGARFETYLILGERGSGQCELNGPAARLAAVGDLVIVIGYATMAEDEARSYQPRVAHVDEHNRLLPA